MCLKPSIVNWAYIGLACLLLSNILGTISTLYYIMFSNDDFVHSPVLLIISAIIITVSTIAVLGLLKKSSWARIVAYSAVGVQAFLMLVMLGINIYYAITTPVPVGPPGFLIVLLVLGVSLLLLAYKIYTSEPLRIYLSKPQLSSR